MLRYINLYWYFLLQRFKILMEYRLNFVIGASSTLIVQTAGILTIWVVMEQIPSLDGWSLYEVLLIYGMIALAKSINLMFADNLWTIGRAYIRTGNFDRFMVRPINPLFHLLADRFNHDGIGDFIVGLLLVIVSTRALSISWTPSYIAYMIIAVISGGVIFIALNLMTGTSAFWLMDAVPVMRLVFDNHLFAQFPLTIYPKAIMVMLTWLIPYGFASFYPASTMMGRDVGTLAWIAPLVAVVLLFVAYRVWLFGLRHYQSTGS